MERRKLSGTKPNLSADCLGRKGSHHPKRLLMNRGNVVQRDTVSWHDGVGWGCAWGSWKIYSDSVKDSQGIRSLQHIIGVMLTSLCVFLKYIQDKTTPIVCNLMLCVPQYLG